MRFLRVLPVLALIVSAVSPALRAQNLVPAFKESGTVMAPVTVELYTDFQCPHCRAFYMSSLQSLITDFVKTGKVRLIHRDFPLSQFQFSRTAIHYANAAGQIGKYDAVSMQLFESQPEWAQNGNVDAAVAKVLSPSEREKVRSIIKNDKHLDDSVDKDVAMGNETDHIMSTPAIIVVVKGKRETINGAPAYASLKAYLESKL
jgi:protein-disulfide isomerase